MQKFEVDDELAALVERLAKPKPFEHISFNDALWRVVRSLPNAQVLDPNPLDQLLADERSHETRPKKAGTPSVADWVLSVPDLKSRRGLLHSWKAVCDLLKIDTGGDSARRKLKNWVRTNKPNWPTVPDID
jgi:hypothetical protein